MKKLFALFLLIGFIWNSGIASAMESYEQIYVNCNKDHKMCTIGDYTLASTKEPLFVGTHVVCSPDKKRCSNGYSLMTSSSPLVTQNGIICKSNLKQCFVGHYYITASKPMKVDTSSVCNYKECVYYQ